MSSISVLVLAFAFPLWLLAGFGDWLCHRHTAIAETSGWRESLLHIVQWMQIAVTAAALTALQFTPAMLALAAASLLAHSATAWWDERYTAPLRTILPIEHTIHGFLDVLPWVAAAALFCHVWFDRPELWDPRWILAPREPLRDARIDAAVGIALLLALLPIVEEALRGRRRSPQ